MSYLDQLHHSWDSLTLATDSVLSTAGQLLAAGSVTKYFHIQNHGSSRVYLNLGGTSTCVAANCIQLTPFGGNKDHFEMKPGNLYTGAISAIAATSGQAVSIRYA